MSLTSMTGTTPCPPSTRIVEAVAEREGVDPRQLEPPLFNVVNPDALDALFVRPADSGEVRTTGLVRFEYLGYTVRLREDGAITVESAD